MQVFVAKLVRWMAVVACASVAAAAGVSSVQAQSSGAAREVGIPFPSKHYALEEQGYDRQNWDLTQDDRGLLYVANSLNGVLVFDGVEWRSIDVVPDTAAARPVRSLATGPDGRVFVGTEDDFGVLQPDSTGRLEYTSLAGHLPPEHRTFRDVWNTVSTRDGVYFQSQERLFLWEGTDVRVWTSDRGFHTAFGVNERLYVRDFGRGLLKMVNGHLREVPGGDRFRDRPIFSMTPHPSGQVLIATAQSGLFMHDETGVRPFKTEADPILRDAVIYDGASLPGGRAAFATLGAGVIVLDADGRIERWLRPDVDLPDGVVNDVYRGQSGELWIAFNNAGVMRASVAPELSLYDARVGLRGTVHDVVRHDGRLYAATGSGVFELTVSSDAATALRGSASFRRIAGVPLAHDLASTSEGLLVAAQAGVYRVQGGRARLIVGRNVTSVVQSTAHPERIYAAGPMGLAILQRTARGWTTRAVEGVSDEVQDLLELDDTLWMTTSKGTVQRVDLAVPATASGTERALGDTVRASVQTFDADDGLRGRFPVLGATQNTLFVATQQTVYRLRRNAATGTAFFEPEPELVPGTGRNGPLYAYLPDDSTSSIWAMRGDAVYHGHLSSRRPPSWHDVDALHFPKEAPMMLYPDGTTLWMGVGNRLLRYDTGASLPPRPPFQALIRSITTIEDSLTIYGGTWGDRDAELQVPYPANDLRVSAAAPHFNTVKDHRYRFWLEGGRDGWTSWMTHPQIEYTDLREGTYRLHVEAQNERGATSQPTVLEFRVLPPWYRTTWAYLVYGLLIVAIGILCARYVALRRESRRVRRESRRSARELASEQKANQELHLANERLRQVNEMKENFLASTSHELRTPITNILGFTDLVREEAPSPLHSHLDVIATNGRRLLRTLNALLDLASLRAGEMVPNYERVNVLLTVLGVVKEMRPGAHEKGLALEVDVPRTAVYARIDERFLEQILRNLLDNAIKFTSDGEVWVRLTTSDDTVAVAVEDEGVGIDPSFIPDLFRDFKQESVGMARNFEGSGLGLAITARLVDRMNGTITVDTVKGEGSTFIVRFPANPPDAGPPSSASANGSGGHGADEDHGPESPHDSADRPVSRERRDAANGSALADSTRDGGEKDG